jgi:hypothetical protein
MSSVAERRRLDAACLAALDLLDGAPRADEVEAAFRAAALPLPLTCDSHPRAALEQQAHQLGLAAARSIEDAFADAPRRDAARAGTPGGGGASSSLAANKTFQR